jgi:hypothetical protein
MGIFLIKSTFVFTQPSTNFVCQGKNFARKISFLQPEVTIGGIDAFSAHADNETILIFGGLSYNANSKILRTFLFFLM